MIATGFPSRDLDHIRDGGHSRHKRSSYISKAPIGLSTTPIRMTEAPRPVETRREERAPAPMPELRQAPIPESRPAPAAAMPMPMPMPLMETKTTQVRPSMEENLARMTIENGSSMSTPSMDPSQMAATERDQRIEGASVGSIASLTGEGLENLDDPEFFTKDDVTPTLGSLSDEMDRKIDEALKIAEQLSKGPHRPQDDEDLDIPSFLRKSSKDLSLS